MVLSSASREVNQESYLPEFLLQATFGAASPGGMSPMSPANARVRTWDVGLGVALENSPTKREKNGRDLQSQAWEGLQLELLGTGRPDLFHHHAAAKNPWWLRAQPYFEPSPRTGRKR